MYFGVIGVLDYHHVARTFTRNQTDIMTDHTQQDNDDVGRPVHGDRTSFACDGCGQGIMCYWDDIIGQWVGNFVTTRIGMALHRTCYERDAKWYGPLDLGDIDTE